jgi:hypothetical protein
LDGEHSQKPPENISMRLQRKLHKENYEGSGSVRSSKTKTKATRMSHNLSGVIL